MREEGYALSPSFEQELWALALCEGRLLPCVGCMDIPDVTYARPVYGQLLHARDARLECVAMLD